MSKLADRMKEYGIPPIPYLPAAKNVLVYRLPADERTSGGLYVPQEHQGTKSRGVLLAAGLAALDVMGDHLIEVGDIVWTSHFAGRDAEVRREEGRSADKVLQLKIEDVLGSVDAIERAKDCEIDVSDEGEHFYVRKTTSKRKVA